MKNLYVSMWDLNDYVPPVLVPKVSVAHHRAELAMAQPSLELTLKVGAIPIEQDSNRIHNLVFLSHGRGFRSTPPSTDRIAYRGLAALQVQKNACFLEVAKPPNCRALRPSPRRRRLVNR